MQLPTLAPQLCPVCSTVLHSPRFAPKTIRTLIREGRRALGMTEAAFGLAVGVTRAAVQHWERKDGTSPNRRTAPRVARVLKISLADFMSGGPRPAPIVHRIQSVPLVSEVEGGGFRKVDNFSPVATLERIEVTVEVRRHTFALQVNGDSMCSSGQHSFPEGTIIVVEPDLEPAAGDFVVVLNDKDEATFKQLALVGKELQLRPLNRRYKSVPLGTSKIIGVVREAIRRFR